MLKYRQYLIPWSTSYLDLCLVVTRGMDSTRSSHPLVTDSLVIDHVDDGHDVTVENEGLIPARRGAFASRLPLPSVRRLILSLDE
jgi:hypothetical protein